MKRAAIQSSILLIAAHAVALAAPLNVAATQGGLSFSALFENLGGGVLQITLSNNGTVAPTDESGVLAALFFNIAGNPTLVPQSVSIASGSAIIDGSGNPSDNWEYATGVAGPGGTTQGISAAGFSIFSSGNFCGSSKCGNQLQGADWGLVNSAYVPGSGNKSLSKDTLIQTSAVFLLSGITAGFDPSLAITGVTAQYSAAIGGVNSTSLVGSDPTLATSASVPEPATLILIGAGLIVVARRRRSHI